MHPRNRKRSYKIPGQTFVDSHTEAQNTTQMENTDNRGLAQYIVTSLSLSAWDWRKILKIKF